MQWKHGIQAQMELLHFFSMPVRGFSVVRLSSLTEGNQPGTTDSSMLVVSDIDDVFLPKPTDLLVNLSEARASLEALLGRLGDMFADNNTIGSALGPALQAGFKLMVCAVLLTCQSQSSWSLLDTDWWQDHCAFCEPAVSRSRCSEKQGGPQDPRYIQGAPRASVWVSPRLTYTPLGIWSSPSRVAVLQDLRH